MEYQMNGNFQTLKSDDGFEFRAFVSKPMTAMTSRKFLTIKCFHHNLLKT